MTARWGKLDFSQLKKFRSDLESNISRSDSITACVNEIADMLLEKVKELTPVGDYPVSSGKVGGTLRNGWGITEVKVDRGVLRVEIFNPVEYAKFVEYGHRTSDGGWVEGRFMLCMAVDEVRKMSRGVLEAEIRRLLP